MLRAALDRLYLIAGGCAALCIILICLIVSAQVGLNILARIGGPSLSFTIPSYADFAGFMLAGATFLAMAHTLRTGTHIRVNLVIQRLPTHFGWPLEVVVLGMGTGLSAYATWFCGALVHESCVYGDMSTGIVAVPIWIPQLTMLAGLGLLTIALAHTLVESLAARAPILSDQGAE